MAFTEIDVIDTENVIYTVANAEDMFRLGLIYSTKAPGRGPDFIEAHKWFSLSASLGNIPSKAYREELKAEMTAQDLTQAQRAAREWMAVHQVRLAA